MRRSKKKSLSFFIIFILEKERSHKYVELNMEKNEDQSF